MIISQLFSKLSHKEIRRKSDTAVYLQNKRPDRYFGV